MTTRAPKRNQGDHQGADHQTTRAQEMPNAPEAESGILGAILFDPREIEECPRLTPLHFYQARHQIIFQVMRVLLRGGRTPDATSVLEYLTATGRLDEIGGAQYLAALVNSAQSIGGVSSWASIVEEQYQRRLLIESAQELARKAVDPGAHPADTMQDAAERLATLAQEGDQEQPRRFKFLTAAEVYALPPLEWLIDGVLPMQATGAIYGAPGAGKSFVALDMAGCIATGTPWRGRSVRRGVVAYVAAEGLAGMKYRLRAWSEAHGLGGAPLPNLYMLADAPQIARPEDLGDLLAALHDLPEPPALVILDTLARCTAGADENSQQDMGLLVQAMDKIRREFGAHVLVVHHSNALGERMRGSSVLAGAFETVLRVEHPGAVHDVTRVSCEKQKDGAAPFEAMPLRLKQVHFADEPRVSSCVLVDMTPDDMAHQSAGVTHKLLSLLVQQGAVCQFGKWKDDAERYAGVKRDSFINHIRHMLEEGYITKGGKRTDPYQITDQGRRLLGDHQGDQGGQGGQELPTSAPIGEPGAPQGDHQGDHQGPRAPDTSIVARGTRGPLFLVPPPAGSAPTPGPDCTHAKRRAVVGGFQCRDCGAFL